MLIDTRHPCERDPVVLAAAVLWVFAALAPAGVPMTHFGVGTAELLGTGDTITAAEARRLACNASILPAVLDNKSHVLDLGRSQRLFTKAQRIALRLRDETCRAEGCSIPGTWTEAHHLVPWSQGGKTDLADAVSLCNFHHHRIHDPRFGYELLSNGDVRFARRT